MNRLIFLLMLLITSTIKADYVTPTLNKLILKADKILYGEIVCVDESVIELNVYNSINHDSRTITIIKFKEWNCGKRWMEYQVGDTSLFFLRLKNGRYQSMGGGNEGELPIRNDKIYVHASTISTAGFVGQFDRSELQIEDNGYNNPYNGYVMDLSDFWQAIAVIKKCFKSEVTATGNLFNIQHICDHSEFESTMNQNKILNWAITGLKS
ncbi:MAG: hypothetical protein WBN20_15320 [Eudoraea sp.]|uniref:hypothetical protein n=1 Tax=Eudoraea sp. TaxID=1979955 RepID=UPI003C775FAF